LIAPLGALILGQPSKEVRMRKFAIAGIAALAIAGSTAVYAQYQHRPWFHGHMHFSPEDRAAFADARIAAVHAGLKLNTDQEKLWPPVETAVRDFAKLRIDRANARMNPEPNSQDAQKADDPVVRLRERADNMAASAAALKKIADAADPLYKTLDDGQKRRLAILTHRGGWFSGEGWRQRGFEHGMMGRGDGDRDRGYGRDRYDRDDGPDRDHDGGSAPERL
jgi:LTXXQ motif family protein